MLHAKIDILTETQKSSILLPQESRGKINSFTKASLSLSRFSSIIQSFRLGARICFLTMESEGKGPVIHKGVVKEEEEKAKEEEEEDEYCNTPTGSANRIPEIQNCPPAPRKRRRSPPSSSSSTLTARSFTAHEFYFFEDTSLQEVDSFFQSINSKLKRYRCRSV